MKGKSMKRVKESQTLAHRLRRGDRLWIDGYFVELVKIPVIIRKPVCEVCGFNRNCPPSVWKVCMELEPDNLCKYGVGKVGRQHAKQEIVEPKA